MTEATGTSILAHGDTDTLDGTGLTEEVPDGILSSVEAEVSTEDSVSLTWGTAGGATDLGLLSGELAGDLSVVEPESVGGFEGLLGVSSLGELDEADTLGLALGHD